MRPWLSKETAAKVDVLGTDYKEVLLELIDEENLPASLGGGCTCDEAGGCHLSGAGPWQDGRVGWGPKAMEKSDMRKSDMETSDVRKSDVETSDVEKNDVETSDVEKSDVEKSDVVDSGGADLNDEVNIQQSVEANNGMPLKSEHS